MSQRVLLVHRPLENMLLVVLRADYSATASGDVSASSATTARGLNRRPEVTKRKQTNLLP